MTPEQENVCHDLYMTAEKEGQLASFQQQFLYRQLTCTADKVGEFRNS